MFFSRVFLIFRVHVCVAFFEFKALVRFFVFFIIFLFFSAHGFLLSLFSSPFGVR